MRKTFAAQAGALTALLTILALGACEDSPIYTGKFTRTNIYKSEETLPRDQYMDLSAHAPAPADTPAAMTSAPAEMPAPTDSRSMTAPMMQPATTNLSPVGTYAPMDHYPMDSQPMDDHLTMRPTLPATSAVSSPAPAFAMPDRASAAATATSVVEPPAPVNFTSGAPWVNSRNYPR